MGKCSFKVVGIGMTKEQALRNALDADRDEYGHQDGYNGSIGSAVGSIASKCVVEPKIAKSCKVEKETSKGAKKWITVYVVEPNFGTTSYNERKEVTTTQGDAIAEAKRLALKYNKTFVVDIQKRLVQGNTRIARITPKNSKQGKWIFSGEARE